MLFFSCFPLYMFDFKILNVKRYVTVERRDEIDIFQRKNRTSKGGELKAPKYLVF